MGWTNFIIIPRLKLVFEISKNVSELMDYKKDALLDIDSEEEPVDVLDTKFSDLTVDNLATLTTGYRKYTNLMNISSNEMFLYWLESNGIDYEIVSEYNIQLDDYKKKNYIIIRVPVHVLKIKDKVLIS